MLDPVTWKTNDGKCHRTFSIELNKIPGKLRLLDQTKLPNNRTYLETDNLEEIFEYIRSLVVRGAPAIGCAAALGLAAYVRKQQEISREDCLKLVLSAAERLAQSRPTAVNLFWSLNRCKDRISNEFNSGRSTEDMLNSLLEEALNILAEDIELCRAIGRHGVQLLHNGSGVLTHCNAGALATGDYGTALAPIYTAHENGLAIKVFSDETRPLLQGARLTAWELSLAGVDVTTICDNMAAQVMREGKVDLVIVGADRIAANGDTANKIGTYGVAILAKYHKIPFYVAAPYSTIDLAMPDGSGIPIEQRSADEISFSFGCRTVPAQANIYNPAFDVTPNELITGIITERGIIYPPFDKQLFEIGKQ
jgi:methylthioribose-1-phosphate isomerase